MRQRCVSFFSIFLFWILFFLVCRGIFLVYHLEQARTLSFAEVIRVFALGLRMDAAMAGYWTILPAILLALSFLFTGPYLRVSINLIQMLLLLISAVLVVADLELYRHWGFRLDTTPLLYLGDEAAGSVSGRVVAVVVVIFLLLVVCFAGLYHRAVLPRLASLRPARPLGALLFLPLVGALFLPIRGGFGRAPLNTGVVFFHRTNPFANHAGINAAWNFLWSVSASAAIAYPEQLCDAEQAQRHLQELTASAHVVPLINTPRPNVILIILESFSASIIEPMGGLPGVTPRLNALVRDGILFDRIFASGDRTDKGLVSIISGYPAQPRSSIIKLPKKSQTLPFVTHDLHALGYQTSFLYGGDINFANMKSYVTEAAFARITTEDDFPDSALGPKWGAHDGVVFERLRQELDTATQPFFKALLSLSSHEPFDVPLRSAWYRPNDERAQFLNSCYYTDSVLGEFIAAARTTGWWKNALIIVTADHGHRFPDQQELKEKKRFRIPLLLLGGAINKRDTIIHTLGSQTDLAPTLLAQLGSPARHYTFGKNLSARQVYPFAVYVFKNGYGFVSEAGECVYDFDLGGYYKNELPATDRQRAAAYMQALFLDFNKR